jgi:putative transposase
MQRAYQKRQGFEEWVRPQEFRVEVAELAGALKDGVTAIGLKAALVMAQQMLEAEVARVAGVKGTHQAQRRAQRHGPQGGYVVLAGRQVKIRRPRVRTVDGQEVPLRNYRGVQQQEILDEAAFERMLYGVASRHYDAVDPALPEDLTAYGAAKSTVSARFARATGALLQQFLQRPLTTRMLVLYLDAIVLGSHAILVALGVDAEGRQHVLGLREGAPENAAITTALLADLVARGLDTHQGLLAVIDGGKALAAAVTRVFGDRVLIQRCQVHQRRNLLEHLPQQDQGWVNARLSAAWALADAGQAQRELEALAAELHVKCPGAAASLREGLDQTLTVQQLRLPAPLRRGLRTTNASEALNSQLRATVRRVSRFTTGDQAVRWAAVAALRAEPRLYRISGYRYLPVLAEGQSPTAAQALTVQAWTTGTEGTVPLVFRWPTPIGAWHVTAARSVALLPPWSVPSPGSGPVRGFVP